MGSSTSHFRFWLFLNLTIKTTQVFRTFLLLLCRLHRIGTWSVMFCHWSLLPLCFIRTILSSRWSAGPASRIQTAQNQQRLVKDLCQQGLVLVAERQPSWLEPVDNIVFVLMFYSQYITVCVVDFVFIPEFCVLQYKVKRKTKKNHILYLWYLVVKLKTWRWQNISTSRACNFWKIWIYVLHVNL